MAVGSAYASVITQFATAIIQVIIAQQIFRFTINWKYIFTLVFFAAGVVIINIILSSQVTNWHLAFIAAGSASLLWAFVLKLIDVGGIIRLLKNG
jgi:hypothetical protein